VRFFIFGVSMLIFCGLTADAQPATQPAPTATLKLWPDGAPLAKGTADADTPTLAVYLPDPSTANGCGIVICPGGGYSHLSMIREGSDVAHWLNSHGVAAFVLKYRLNPYRQPVPMLDGQRAMRLARFHATDWNIDPNRIGMMGFSAGGHVASTIGTHFDSGNPAAPDPIDRLGCRPDFLVLLYPVISMKQEIAHAGSRHFLLGDIPSDELVQSLSNETQVTAQTPPTFLAASKTDPTVKIINSELFYQALQKAGVPSQLVEFNTGGHGWGLAPNNPELAVWKDTCLTWMNERGFMSPSK
jgi:acetyl esterase/lipase